MLAAPPVSCLTSSLMDSKPLEPEQHFWTCSTARKPTSCDAGHRPRLGSARKMPSWLCTPDYHLHATKCGGPAIFHKDRDLAGALAKPDLGIMSCFSTCNPLCPRGPHPSVGVLSPYVTGACVPRPVPGPQRTLGNSPGNVSCRICHKVEPHALYTYF